MTPHIHISEDIGDFETRILRDFHKFWKGEQTEKLEWLLFFPETIGEKLKQQADKTSKSAVLLCLAQKLR